jgi:hypothetical protein
MQMELVTNVVTIALSFAVGLPILIKALRTGDRLVALLSGSLVVDGLEWLFWAFYLYWPGSNPSVNDAFATACRLGISVSVLCLGCFTWLTFRSQSAAAALAFRVSLGAMAIGFLGSGAAGDWRGFRSDHPWIWIENLAQILVYGWACVEALLYHLRARKRVAHGLADPVLVNKFALWGIYAGCYGGVQLLFLVALASPDGFTQLGAVDIALTLVGIGSLWLAFFPHRIYLAWVRGAPPLGD